MIFKRHNKIELDATGQVPGRLATKIATYLMGKHEANYVPYHDQGSAVLVKNAAAIILQGKKLAQKVYRHHSMHPGGLKEIPAKKVLAENPTEVIIHAVARMLPKNKFRTARLKRLTFK